MDNKKNRPPQSSAAPERRVYGVALMEWQALLPAGFGVVKVHFTGGCHTGYSRRPATFSTDNPALIRIIENSLQFKSGKIFRVRWK